MRIFKKTLLITVLLITLSIVSEWMCYNSFKPNYFGKIELLYIEKETQVCFDISDIENSMSILPTGQSENPFSEHYKDQAKMYNNGEFRKMELNKSEIISNSTKLTIAQKNE